MLRLLLVLVVLLGPAALRPALAADPGPYLRIETGDHEADVNGLALLDDGQAVVTVSDDKTARIWSADGLALQAVLRPPVGPLDQGALYAVAAHGERIVVAGRTGTPGHYALYLFSRQGRPLGNISGIGQPVTALRFSPSGNELAVGQQDNGGLRLFDLKGQTELTGDTGVVGAIHGLDFDPQGRLAAEGDDGTVRLYAPDGHRLSVLSLPPGAHPWGLAFSPDGHLLAVGDRQAPLVYLIDATSMRLLRTLEGEPGRNGGFTAVAFGLDSSYVVGAGLYSDKAGQHYARSWSVADGRAIEAPLARDTVNALVLLPNGMVFATAEPSIGRTNASGHIAVERTAHHIDLRDAGLSSFRLSPDGSQIELPANRTDGRHIVFDLPHRILELREGGPDFTRPRDTGPNLKLADWRNSQTPRLIGGKPIVLDDKQNEHVRSAAVSPNGDGVALGTDFYVRYVGLSGEVWHKVADAVVWAVNVSADGTRVVAGMGDGTVHWYDAQTGAELCALFIEPATGRWVLRTPDGFFDHDHPNDGSPDGRSLIGYDLNSPDGRAADFVQIGQLYRRFFRPDVIGLSFRDTPETQAIVENERQRIGKVRDFLAQGLPPVVQVTDYCGHASTSHASGCPATRALDAKNGAVLSTTADEVLVDYKVTAAKGGKLGTVQLARDGAVIAPHVLTVEEDDASRTQEARIPLGMGLNVIQVRPVAASGLEEQDSRASEIRVMRGVPVAQASPAPAPVTPSPSQPSPPSAGQSREAAAEPSASTQPPNPPAPPAQPRTTLYVLSVGVSNYARPEFKLGNPRNDAQAVAALFAQPNPPVYDKSVVKTLLDDQATAPNIEAALKDIAASAGPDDIVMLFFAGHGEAVRGEYYYAPYDFGTHDDTLRMRALAGNLGAEQWLDTLFEREGVGQGTLIPAVQAIRSSRVVMILDTCYSASIATQDLVLNANRTVAGALNHASGRFVLSSAIALAADSPGAQGGSGHGKFTSFMLRALQGEAADRWGMIDAVDVAKYTQHEVQDQKPEFYYNGNDPINLRAVSRNSGTAPG